jgi:hypothetical protein
MADLPSQIGFVTKGEPVSADKENEQSAAINRISERLGLTFGPVPKLQEGNARDIFLAVITANHYDSTYSWDELRVDVANCYFVDPGGRTGIDAKELSNSVSVPVGTAVLMLQTWSSAASAEYRFLATALISSSSSSTSSDSTGPTTPSVSSSSSSSSSSLGSSSSSSLGSSSSSSSVGPTWVNVVVDIRVNGLNLEMRRQMVLVPSSLPPGDWEVFALGTSCGSSSSSA